jgi:hypothetical protein
VVEDAASDFTFAEAAVEKVVGDDPFTNEVTDGAGTGLFTYSSGTEATATVDETGEVTIVAAGTTVISATKAASDGFAATTKTYTLTVAAEEEVVEDAASDFGFDESAVSKVVGDGVFTRNATDDVTAGTGLITYSSGTEATATVDETGEVTILAAGTTVISATKAASDGFTATTKTYTLTVAAAAPSPSSGGSSSSTTQSVVPVINPPTSSKWLKLTNNVLKVNFASKNKGKTIKIYNNQKGKTILVGTAKLNRYGNATIKLNKKVLPGSLFAMIGKQIKNVITIE